jgi:hypothetical protein
MHLKICPYKAGQSLIAPSRARMWMKSKVFGAKVHSLCASSSSKRQFGGTQRGWTSERSVPMTSAEGYWSAKSLSSFSGEFSREKGHKLHCPYPSSSANVEDFLSRSQLDSFSWDLQISKK